MAGDVEPQARPVEPEIRAAGQIEGDRGAADRQRLMHRRTGVVERENQCPGERDTGRQRQRDVALQLPGDAVREHDERALPFGEADAVRSGAQREGHVAGGDRGRRAAVAEGDTLEREVAAQALTEQAQGQPDPLGTDVRADRQVQHDVGSADLECAADSARLAVDREAEGAAERDARDGECDRAGDPAGDARAAGDQGARPVGDAQRAERDGDVRRGDRDFTCCGLVEGEVARDRLAGDRELRARSLERLLADCEVEDDVRPAARHAQRPGDHPARGVDTNGRGPGDRDAVDADEADGAGRNESVRRADAHDADARGREEDARRERVQAPVRELCRATAEEDAQVLTGERVAREREAALDRHEVTDVQRQIGDRDREDVSFGGRELDRDAAAREVDRLVDGSAGLVDAQEHVAVEARKAAVT